MLLAMALAATVSLSQAERDAFFDKPPHNTLHDCGAEMPKTGACRLPPNLTAQDVTAKLAGRNTAWWREGDQFIVVAMRDTDQAYLCCSARGRMDRIGADLWALRLYIADLDRATLDVWVVPAAGAGRGIFRGPLALPAPALAQNLQGQVHYHQFDSNYLDKPRPVAIYTPPGFDPAMKYPTVYLADSNMRLDTPKLIEPLILNGTLPPIILVEIWNAQSNEGRSREYLLGWPHGASRFNAHTEFLLDELIPYVEKNFAAPPDARDRIVSGFSSGAAWAIAMGLQHPGVFGTVIAQSLVWGDNGASIPASHLSPTGGSMGISPRMALSHQFMDDAGLRNATRFFLSAGTLEPAFYRQTLRYGDALRNSGHVVKLETTVSGHTLTIFQPMLIEGLEWALAKKQ